MSDIPKEVSEYFAGLARKRSESQTPEERKAIGKHAVETRWKRYRSRQRNAALTRKRYRENKSASVQLIDPFARAPK